MEKEAHKIIHANPIPHMGVPFIPNLNHKVTESKPFSFENRDKIIQARKEEKIQDMLNEEKEVGVIGREDSQLPRRRWQYVMRMRV